MAKKIKQIIIVVLLLCGILQINTTRAEAKDSEYQKVTVTKPSKMKKQDIAIQNYSMLHCGEKIKLTVNGKMQQIGNRLIQKY